MTLAQDLFLQNWRTQLIGFIRVKSTFLITPKYALVRWTIHNRNTSLAALLRVVAWLHRFIRLCSRLGWHKFVNRSSKNSRWEKYENNHFGRYPWRLSGHQPVGQKPAVEHNYSRWSLATGPTEKVGLQMTLSCKMATLKCIIAMETMKTTQSLPKLQPLGISKFIPMFSINPEVQSWHSLMDRRSSFPVEQRRLTRPPELKAMTGFKLKSQSWKTSIESLNELKLT